LNKILYLSQLLPYPPDAGPKVRSYYTIRHLCEQHNVTLIAFTRPDDQPQSIDHLKEFCKAVHTVQIHRSRIRDIGELAISLVNDQSFTIRRDYVKEMAQKIDQLIQSITFDAIHADQLWMAQYALRARTLCDKGNPLKLVLDEHNACFQIFQRLASGESNPIKRAILQVEERKLADYEAGACAQFDQVVTVTKDDQETLRDLINKAKSVVSVSNPPSTKFLTIPICVDTQLVQPITAKPNARDILYIGTMFFGPNVEGVLWFVKEVWPRVIAQIPQATCTIVGKNPPKVVRDLSTLDHRQQATIKSGLRNPIRITGYISDLKPYLEQAAVFIVPLLSGSGMRVKILDAWRWGLPVVSTGIGAEGLEYQDGVNIMIAKSPDDFARSMIRVILEPVLAQSLRENGRHWVEEHYEWRRVYKAWDAVYEDICH
jgi:glycosyltransferase involved in cell wall biosynthesis